MLNSVYGKKSFLSKESDTLRSYRVYRCYTRRYTMQYNHNNQCISLRCRHHQLCEVHEV